VDDRRLATLFCSPFNLDELAVGHLVTRGMLVRRSDLLSLLVCPDYRSVQLRTATGAGLIAQAEDIVYSGCGAARVGEIGTAVGAGTAGFPPPPRAAPDRPRYRLQTLTELSAKMFSMAELYARTGGMHAAALAREEDGYFVMREDVGRHNALDKVLGRGFLDGITLQDSVLLTSGRIASDMVLKAVHAGVYVLVSRSIPTTEAYSIAVREGVTLVGRIGTSTPVVYTWKDRIRN